MSFAESGPEQRLWDRDVGEGGRDTDNGEASPGRAAEEPPENTSVPMRLPPGHSCLSPPSTGFKAAQISQDDPLLRPLTCLHLQRPLSTSAAFQPSSPPGYVLFRLGLTCLASPSAGQAPFLVLVLWPLKSKATPMAAALPGETAWAAHLVPEPSLPVAGSTPLTPDLCFPSGVFHYGGK